MRFDGVAEQKRNKSRRNDNAAIVMFEPRDQWS